jgi:hypothetical protein
MEIKQLDAQNTIKDETPEPFVLALLSGSSTCGHDKHVIFQRSRGGGFAVF